MHEVSRRVRARNRAAPLEVDRSHDLLAHDGLTALDASPVDVQSRNGLLDVVDEQHGTIRERDDTGIGQLATALGVERRAVEHDLDTVSLAGAAHALAVGDQALQHGFGHDLVVTGEARDPRVVHDVAVDGRGREPGLPLALGCLGTIALLGHETAEAVLVDFDALLSRHLQREVEREPIGVVEGERRIACERGASRLLQVGHRSVEDRRARAQRLTEGDLLLLADADDAPLGGNELGILRTHRRNGRGDQLSHHRVARTQDPHVADDATHDASQHVATTLIARKDTIGDEERTRARVVGHDAQAYVGIVILAVTDSAELAGAIEDHPCRVDLVDVVDALQQGRHALEAHAGVDVLGRKASTDVEVVLGSHGRELVLHEDEVPHLEVAVLVRDRSTLATMLGPAVVVDLRARATGSGDTHGPVVVLGIAALDAVEWHAHGAMPDVDGLVVVLVDRAPETTLGEAVSTVGLRTGEELPGERDRARLEVVAEGEVARHLEERGVACGLADLVDVESAHDLLHRRGPRPRRRGLAQEVGLEGHHAGVDEQQRGVVEQQGRRRHCGVTALGEVAQEARADLGGVHQGRTSRLSGAVVLSFSGSDPTFVAVVGS